MQHLLQSHHRVIYFDSDCFFVDDWSFLWDEVDPILVTPHWRSKTNPRAQTHDVFNAGLVGATRSGRDALQWWKSCCLERLEIDLDAGFYLDQKYLDQMPVKWKANVCQHRGVNAAYWNSNRTNLVMVHLTGKSLSSGALKKDPVLSNYLADYERQVELSRNLLERLCNVRD
ncbi:MAG: hypothetical protein HKN47_05980 [Pirellulaceae bacterium]|nr:hypothetical protein [Pirellulaceae bacterium]